MSNKNHENTVLIDIMLLGMMFFVRMLAESADLGCSKGIMLYHPDALLIDHFFLEGGMNKIRMHQKRILKVQFPLGY